MEAKLYYNGELIKEDSVISFTDSYFYLSNYSNYNTIYEGITYKSSEAAFQAQKTLDNKKKIKFSSIDPSTAKDMGRKLKLRKDWNEVKDNIMYNILKAKFDNNPDIKELLLSTGDRELFEGNNWNDTYWGVIKVNNTLLGENKLGKLLMKLRREYFIKS